MKGDAEQPTAVTAVEDSLEKNDWRKKEPDKKLFYGHIQFNPIDAILV